MARDEQAIDERDVTLLYQIDGMLRGIQKHFARLGLTQLEYDCGMLRTDLQDAIDTIDPDSEQEGGGDGQR